MTHLKKHVFQEALSFFDRALWPFDMERRYIILASSNCGGNRRRMVSQRNWYFLTGNSIQPWQEVKAFRKQFPRKFSRHWGRPASSYTFSRNEARLDRRNAKGMMHSGIISELGTTAYESVLDTLIYGHSSSVIKSHYSKHTRHYRDFSGVTSTPIWRIVGVVRNVVI